MFCVEPLHVSTNRSETTLKEPAGILAEKISFSLSVCLQVEGPTWARWLGEEVLWLSGEPIIESAVNIPWAFHFVRTTHINLTEGHIMHTYLPFSIEL
jgi:hypothetical protein